MDLGRKGFIITEEIWKPIEINGASYWVSNYGNVRGTQGQIALRLNPDGYVVFTAGVRGKRRCIRTHQVVAKLFIPNDNPNLEVNHKDFDRTNNHVDNLEWVTHTENIKYSYLYNREGMCDRKGSKNSNAKLCESDVIRIRQLLADGKTVMEISKLYGRGWQTINHIKYNTTWQSI